MSDNNIRNIAIIAHVDHGKTTLVDELLKQSGVFRVNEAVADRVMDSNDLERERGITILAKNTAIQYQGIKVNIIDTPGHADFGGEVERIVKMVDGVLLVVDAFDGPMPQTRFVLKKALGEGLRTLVVVNKIDRDGARPLEVVDEVLDLFIDLGASEEQLDFPVVFTSARMGVAGLSPDEIETDMRPLLEAILTKIPPPVVDEESPLQMLISSLDYDNYVGRLGIGKITRGIINRGQEITLCTTHGTMRNARINRLYTFVGLKKVEVESAASGNIVVISGIEDLNIGDTVCHTEQPEALPFVAIEEPTISMNFLVNDSPLAGREGTYVTSRHIRGRLERELLSNVALRVEDTDSTDSFKVSGRGELHLSILIETMRREGYEFAVSTPQVIYREINGITYEPMELLLIEVPEEYSGIVMEKLGQRRGELRNMSATSGGTVRLEFGVPARGLIGYRSEMLTDTRGNGVMSHLFDGYEPYKGDLKPRTRGSLIASEPGNSVAYGLNNAQERGNMFIDPGVEVYEGMVVGESARAEDIVVNVCKKKHLTNTRASGSDDALRLTPPIRLSLEQAIEFIADDELVEITPKNIRLRKKILDKNLRNKAAK
ncbi:MAG: translational GTPase TypA [Methylocystaceae bacterium]